MSAETTREAPADVMAEITRLREACRTLGKIVTWQARSMRAAVIEDQQNGSNAAMQWILNSLPDVDDNPPELQWDGTETAAQWLDRVEAADKTEAGATE